MNKILLTALLCLFSTLSVYGMSLSSEYQDLLMDKVGEKTKVLAAHPSLKYPNKDYDRVLKKFPEGKILLFGYGSLINPQSAANTIGPEAVKSLRPAMAFGFTRIFNYIGGEKWRKNAVENERASLNIQPMTTPAHMINGVMIEINADDLVKLIARERGYDLVPILVADWNDVTSENPSVEVKLAYTFSVANQIREGVKYVETKYYPTRYYLSVVREGVLVFGQEFLDFWNETTYMANGTTCINDWDQETFTGILDSRENR